MRAHMDGERVEEKSVLGSPQQRTLVPRESRFNKCHIHETVGRHDEAGKDPEGLVEV